MTDTSVNFDRAAAVYDSTRGLPPAAERELIDVLAGELSNRGSCLEVGVGTGRLAVPLRRRGIDMYGCDISVGMLTELLRKGEDGPLPLSRSPTPPRFLSTTGDSAQPWPATFFTWYRIGSAPLVSSIVWSSRAASSV